MPNAVATPTILLNSEEFRAEVFRKFGIEHSADQNISEEALRVIECLGRACLPIIGEHCRDAVRLHEAKLKTSGKRSRTNQEVDSEKKPPKIMEDAQRKHKRLTAQKEVDRTVAVSCQLSTDLLNRGGHLLQKTAPLLPVREILSQHLQALKQIHVPKLVRAEGNLPSLTRLVKVTPKLDEVAKYSVQCFLQKGVFDHCDGERAISVLKDAVSEINADLQRLASAPPDVKLGDNVMNIFAHVCGVKELGSKVQKACAERENACVQLGEEIAKKCTEIISSKNSKLGECRSQSSSNPDQMFMMESLQENLVEIIQILGTRISSVESMENGIASNFVEICNSRDLEIARNILPTQRNPYNMVQPVSKTCPTSKGTPATFCGTLLEDELEARMEKLEIDPQENSTALECLASMEFGVDGSKIHKAVCIPPGNVDEVVNELTNFETISVARMCDP